MYPVLGLAGFFALAGCGLGSQRTVVRETAPNRSIPVLRRDRTVVFVDRDTRADLARAVVQVADNEEERNVGLMYRSVLPDSTGMLFIFERPEPQSFWMKNTAVSLDIVFVNENLEIVKIHAYTTPYAIDSFLSGKNAQYVIEVKGGFCQKHGVGEGDLVRLAD